MTNGSARHAVFGMAAGAAGTAALNAVSYADMALRSRPASKLPQQVAKAIAQRAGFAPPKGPRARAFGALLGYVDGFGAGALYGVVRPVVRGVPWYAAGVGLAAFTLLLSEGIATAMGQTDPREWDAADWLADIVPRCAYGLVTALTYESLAVQSD